MTGFRFEEPPAGPPTSRAYRTQQHLIAAAALRERPGEWAMIKTTETSSAARSSAAQIRSAVLVAYRPAGSFGATARTVDGEHRVYARYLGEAVEGGTR